ncbi:MAG: Aldose 1-epimerase [Gemmatimonadetes bacterium]|nr:Aldose 1-epimerase [Gemmatimonadota bacterium]
MPIDRPVETEAGRGGLPKLTLRHACGSSAEIYLHGAHVASWRDAAGVERLFLSSRAQFGADSSIRGGIPVIFPQFADLGPLPKHGFARTAEWTVASALHGGAEPARAVLRLADCAATQAVWPHAFGLELRLELDERLRVTLAVTNPGADAFDFTAALHTYFRVPDVREAAVEGLEGVRFVDKADHGDARVEASSHVRIAGEVDRVYQDAPGDLHVTTLGGGGLSIAREGFPDVVLWNPGQQKGDALSDMAPGEYRWMLCLEAAAVAQPVTLGPGETWTASQLLTPLP